jgi:hypothetical protein
MMKCIVGLAMREEEAMASVSSVSHTWTYIVNSGLSYSIFGIPDVHQLLSLSVSCSTAATKRDRRLATRGQSARSHVRARPKLVAVTGADYIQHGRKQVW